MDIVLEPVGLKITGGENIEWIFPYLTSFDYTTTFAVRTKLTLTLADGVHGQGSDLLLKNVFRRVTLDLLGRQARRVAEGSANLAIAVQQKLSND